MVNKVFVNSFVRFRSELHTGGRCVWLAAGRHIQRQPPNGRGELVSSCWLRRVAKVLGGPVVRTRVYTHKTHTIKRKTQRTPRKRRLAWVGRCPPPYDENLCFRRPITQPHSLVTRANTTPLSPGRRGAATARGALGWYRPSVGVSRDVGC